MPYHKKWRKNSFLDSYEQVVCIFFTLYMLIQQSFDQSISFSLVRTLKYLASAKR